MSGDASEDAGTGASEARASEEVGAVVFFFARFFCAFTVLACSMLARIRAAFGAAIGSKYSAGTSCFGL